MPDKRRLVTWKFPLDPKKMVSWKHSNNKYALVSMKLQTKGFAYFEISWRFPYSFLNPQLNNTQHCWRFSRDLSLLSVHRKLNFDQKNLAIYTKYSLLWKNHRKYLFSVKNLLNYVKKWQILNIQFTVVS